MLKLKMQARKEIWELKEKQKALEIAKRNLTKKNFSSESVRHTIKN